MLHILNPACPELTFCGQPSRCSNYLWGRVVTDGKTCDVCVTSFLDEVRKFPFKNINPVVVPLAVAG